MRYRLFVAIVFGVAAFGATQSITPAPSGPYRTEGNRIVDAKGRTYLLRGTQLTPFRLDAIADDNRAGVDYGAHSATTLTAARLRFNMNAARLPVNVEEAARPNFFAELDKVVQRATSLELLVVLAANKPDVAFWSRAAAQFKNNPNVFFAVASPDANEQARAIRAAGATQPIVAAEAIDDANAIREIAPDVAVLPEIPEGVPVLANGWDIKLDDAEACSKLPSDPSAMEALVQRALNYYDAHQVSWTVSEFKPGKMVTDFSVHDATSLENGWTCGHLQYPYAGMGRAIEAHLRATEERSLFFVSAAGGPDLPRGGFANGYGPAMAERDASGSITNPPTTLAGLAVDITDSAGVTRPAGILFANAGWGQLNIVIPAESAVGPARLTVVRKDGNRTVTNITIADTAPGFRTGLSCRGAALGTAMGASIADCSKGPDCKTAPIAVAKTGTRVRLIASGFRYARSAKDIEVTVGGVRVPVISYAPSKDAGMDDLVIEIPASLRGLGETDVISRVNGRVSNAVRIRIG